MAEEKKSIVPDKYRGKYRGAPKDWFTGFLDAQVTKPVTRSKVSKDETGAEVVELVTLKQTRLDMDALFELGRKNHIDVDGKYGDQVDRPNAAGRLRMTIGNILRRVARERHGLFGVDGTWADAPADWLDGSPKTHTPEGTRIPKPSQTAEEPKAEETEEAA